MVIVRVCALTVRVGFNAAGLLILRKADSHDGKMHGYDAPALEYSERKWKVLLGLVREFSRLSRAISNLSSCSCSFPRRRSTFLFLLLREKEEERGGGGEIGVLVCVYLFV